MLIDTNRVLKRHLLNKIVFFNMSAQMACFGLYILNLRQGLNLVTKCDEPVTTLKTSVVVVADEFFSFFRNVLHNNIFSGCIRLLCLLYNIGRRTRNTHDTF